MEKKYYRIKRPLALFCVLFLLILRLILWITGPPDDPYEGFSGEEVIASGKVVKKEHKNGKEAIYLKEVILASEGTFSAGDHHEKNSCGLVLYIKTDETNAANTLPLYGSRISVQGKISLFREARNPGTFDMRGYYLCKGFGAAVYPSDDTYPFEYVSEEYSVWKELLWRVRLKLEAIFSTVLDEEDAGVMRAMLLGDKSELSQDLKSLYQMSGIAHILAISGLHISIIGMGLYRGLRKMTLPVLPAAVTGALIMTAYAQMTGSGTSTIRAVTMFLVMVVGDSLRKSYDLPTALALSAFTTVFTDPYEIMTSGFLLSYGAVFGIAVFYPAVKGNIRPDEWLLTEDHSVWGKFVRKAFDAVTGGICVTAFTMPLIAASYYEIPVYSFVLNLLVVPLMTILMCAGILILIAGSIFLPSAYVPAAVCHAVLTLYRLLCEASSSLPFSHFICGSPDTLQIVLCYAVFISVVVFSKKWKMIFRVTVIPAGLMLLFFRAPRGFGVTMLDVGQGDGICIADEKTVYMVDGGSSSERQLFEYTLEPFLKYNAYRKVDLWFLTHPDKDHISGLMEMLDLPDCGGISIGTIVLPDAYGAEEDFKDLIILAKKHDIEIVYFSAGDKVGADVCGDETRFICLHPYEAYMTDDKNEYSQVLYLTHGEFSMLLTGDATKESEMSIMSSTKQISADERAILCREVKDQIAQNGITVLKCAHHGSKYSNSIGWLKYLRPSVAFISCGENNRYGHPHEETLERLQEAGAPVYRTDESGAVMVSKDRKGMYIETFLHPK